LNGYHVTVHHFPEGYNNFLFNLCENTCSAEIEDKVSPREVETSCIQRAFESNGAQKALEFIRSEGSEQFFFNLVIGILPSEEDDGYNFFYEHRNRLYYNKGKKKYEYAPERYAWPDDADPVEYTLMIDSTLNTRRKLINLAAGTKPNEYIDLGGIPGFTFGFFCNTLLPMSNTKHKGIVARRAVQDSGAAGDIGTIFYEALMKNCHIPEDYPLLAALPSMRAILDKGGAIFVIHQAWYDERNAIYGINKINEFFEEMVEIPLLLWTQFPPEQRSRIFRCGRDRNTKRTNPYEIRPFFSLVEEDLYIPLWTFAKVIKMKTCGHSAASGSGSVLGAASGSGSGSASGSGSGSASCSVLRSGSVFGARAGAGSGSSSAPIPMLALEAPATAATAATVATETKETEAVVSTNSSKILTGRGGGYRKTKKRFQTKHKSHTKKRTTMRKKKLA
jgi:hypothetical protein